MSDVTMSINSTFGKNASKNEIGLEAKIKASMRAVIAGDWMGASDDSLFRASLAGVLTDIGKDSEDAEKLIRSFDALEQLSAFIAAASAGLDVSPPNIESDDILPLSGWWNEIRGEAK